MKQGVKTTATGSVNTHYAAQTATNNQFFGGLYASQEAHDFLQEFEENIHHCDWVDIQSLNKVAKDLAKGLVKDIKKTYLKGLQGKRFAQIANIWADNFAHTDSNGSVLMKTVFQIASGMLSAYARNAENIKLRYDGKDINLEGMRKRDIECIMPVSSMVYDNVINVK